MQLCSVVPAAQRCAWCVLDERERLPAGFMVSGLEVGGLAGSLLAGRLADGMVNRAKDPIKEGSVGKRVQVRSALPSLAELGRGLSPDQR